MQLKSIDEGFSVSPQIQLEDVVEAKALGFKSIISNRPDGEEAGQITAEQVKQNVENSGLSFRHLPVISGKISDEEVASFREYLSNAETPVLGFCRTGTRCTHLWAMATASNDNIDEIVSKAAAAGYDISALVPRLQALAASRD